MVKSFSVDSPVVLPFQTYLSTRDKNNWTKKPLLTKLFKSNSGYVDKSLTKIYFLKAKACSAIWWIKLTKRYSDWIHIVPRLSNTAIRNARDNGMPFPQDFTATTLNFLRYLPGLSIYISFITEYTWLWNIIRAPDKYSLIKSPIYEELHMSCTVVCTEITRFIFSGFSYWLSGT